MAPPQVDALLGGLCVDLGFCLPPVEQESLKQDPPSDVDAFTDAVFLAEGMDPQDNLHLRRQVKARVAKHFRAAGESNEGCRPQ